MKKYFIGVVIIIVCYFSVVGVFFTMNQKLTFNDIDFDKNTLLTFSELTSDIGILYNCYQKDKIIKSDINIAKIEDNQCDLITEEIFLKKDGVRIKETIYQHNKRE